MITTTLHRMLGIALLLALSSAAASAQTCVPDTLASHAHQRERLARGVWVRWNAGCGTLISHSGRRLWTEQFDHVRGAYHLVSRTTRDSTWLRVDQVDSIGKGYRYVLLSRGRVAAVSPSRYRDSYSASLTDFTLLPAGLTRIASADSGGMGLLDGTTLHERLASRWRGVGGVAFVADGKLVAPYLLADDGEQLHLFRTNGRRVAMPTFHRIETLDQWSRVNWRGKFTRVFAVSDTLRGTCRLYDTRLRQIVPEEIATTRAIDWRCQRLSARMNEDSVQFLVFADTLGLTHSYRVGARAVTRMASDISGRAVYVFPNGAMIVRRPDAAGIASYESLRPDGTPFPNATFTDIKLLGCGFVWVMREGKWFSPGDDGSVSTRLGYPFSC
jgi:hypothetical protein